MAKLSRSGDDKTVVYINTTGIVTPKHDELISPPETDRIKVIRKMPEPFRSQLLYGYPIPKEC